jgi:hypothetical protein
MIDYTASVAVRDVPWAGLQPIGHAINRGGPKGLDTKSPIFGVAPDPMHVPRCSLVLAKSLMGGVTSVRYLNEDIHLNAGVHNGEVLWHSPESFSSPR